MSTANKKKTLNFFVGRNVKQNKVTCPIFCISGLCGQLCLLGCVFSKTGRAFRFSHQNVKAAPTDYSLTCEDDEHTVP